jgi:hypothetical protein
VERFAPVRTKIEEYVIGATVGAAAPKSEDGGS